MYIYIYVCVCIIYIQYSIYVYVYTYNYIPGRRAYCRTVGDRVNPTGGRVSGAYICISILYIYIYKYLDRYR